MKRIFAVISGIALLTASDVAASGLKATGDSARIEIRAYMPLICGAEVSGFNVVSHSPLIIDATVRQSCNGDHELVVNYDPLSVTNAADLSFDYDGRGPAHATLGSAGFGNEHHTDSVRALHIVYAGGTEAERDQFEQTITIAVTPR